MNKYNFFNKFLTTNKIIITNFLILSFYFFSITLIPVINIKQSNSKIFFSKQKNINDNFLFVKAENNSQSTIINTATYIYTGQMQSRQINNNNLQSYINDAKGSVLKLNDYSDKTNSLIYYYDAYGNVIVDSSRTGSREQAAGRRALELNNNKSRSFLLRWKSISSAIPNSFQYNGERFDNNTQLQYLRARFYNPGLKTFINQDTYDLLNKFGYAEANPVSYNDPTGNNIWGDIGNGISTVWNYIASAWNYSINAKVGFITGAAIVDVAATSLIGYKIRRYLKSKISLSVTAQNTIGTNESARVFVTNSASFHSAISTMDIVYIARGFRNSIQSELFEQNRASWRNSFKTAFSENPHDSSRNSMLPSGVGESSTLGENRSSNQLTAQPFVIQLVNKTLLHLSKEQNQGVLIYNPKNHAYHFTNSNAAEGYDYAHGTLPPHIVSSFHLVLQAVGVQLDTDDFSKMFTVDEEIKKLNFCTRGAANLLLMTPPAKKYRGLVNGRPTEFLTIHIWHGLI